VILAAALNAPAQVTIGDNVSMNLDGQLSVGYNADYGNAIPSDHGLNWGGNGSLSGSYYSPSFLSFVVNPYYNQSRANSTSQAISDSSGITASAFLFAGSHFPGSVSYSKTYNSLGTFGLPGVPDYTAHGNTDAFNVGWGVNVPDLPTVSVNYMQGHSDYSIYGANTNGTTSFHNLNTHANYKVAGFNLNGGYVYAQNHSDYPLIYGTQELETADSTNNTFSFGASHYFPLHGSFAANYSRSYFNSDFSQSQFSGTVDTVGSNVTVHPISTLTLGTNFSYTDNLLGTLYQNLVSQGGVVQQSTPGQSSNSWDISGLAGYNLTQHILLTGTVEHRAQTYLGNSFGSNGLTGSVSYWKQVLGGALSSVLSVTRTSVDTANLSTVGFLVLGTYSHKVENWDLSGSLNYYRNTQTVLVGYTTSGWGYSGLVGRTISFLHWSATASGSHSQLNTSAGYGNHSQNYTTGLNVRWFGVNGSYTKSDGTALIGIAGPIPVPLPTLTPLPTNLILYGGHSYGLGVGLNPLKRLTFTASYSRAFSDTQTDTTPSNNQTKSVVARLQYQYRQMWFTAGYSQFMQGFSASPTPPAQLNSYFFGVQRWFNLF